MTADPDLLARYHAWSPAGQQAAAEALAAARESPWRPFYCGSRSCDGLPHDRWGWNHARGDQHPPRGDWSTWIELSGRGAGKTRNGSEWTHRMTKVSPLITLVAPTAADARDTMVEGESGLLATASPANPCQYEPSKRRITWANGARGTLFSGEEPSRLRGPQHHAAWVDEACFMAAIGEVWDMLLFGLRLGQRPRVHVTTTPKPRPWLKQLMGEADTVVSTATTYANLANLAPVFQRQVLAKYEGTRLGRQEIHAEILDDVEGALWTGDLIEAARVAVLPVPHRVAVGVDPPGSLDGAEAGIVVAGTIGQEGYVLEDLSGHYSPNEWAGRAVEAYHRWHAEAIVVETAYGGEMVVSTIRTIDATVPILRAPTKVGKRLRAEPVAALYEQGRVHHVGVHGDLEGQQTGWVPDEGESPDRLDALVHVLTHLMIRAAVGVLATPASTKRRLSEPVRRP